MRCDCNSHCFKVPCGVGSVLTMDRHMSVRACAQMPNMLGETGVRCQNPPCFLQETFATKRLQAIHAPIDMCCEKWSTLTCTSLTQTVQLWDGPPVASPRPLEIDMCMVLDTCNEHREQVADHLSAHPPRSCQSSGKVLPTPVQVWDG